MLRKGARRRGRVDRRTRQASIERASDRLGGLLEKSPTFASLTTRRQRSFIRHAEQLIELVSGPYDLRPPDQAQVDIPEFVADLIDGVFQAIVNASIEQMEAYGDLLKDATKSVAEFEGSSRRQQRLATMVLMGINRIVVTDGRITVRPCDD